MGSRSQLDAVARRVESPFSDVVIHKLRHSQEWGRIHERLRGKPTVPKAMIAESWGGAGLGKPQCPRVEC